MKIIIAIRSLWACKILNGEKSIEVRKGLALYNVLKRAEEKGEQVEFLMYVTKAKPHLKTNQSHSTFYFTEDSLSNLNGKVVARFKAKAEVINYDHNEYEQWFATHSMNEWELYERSGLDYAQLDDYLTDGQGTALHIEELEIFDKPKTLADYGLKRAPESWCYAKEGD